MRRIAWLFAFFVSTNALAQDKSAIAVLDIQGTGIEADLLPTLTEILTVEIDALGKYKVIAGRDIQAMLGFEKQKDVLGCTDAACLAEIGGALGVKRIVASHIGKVGSTYVVNIKLINIRMADTEGRVYETVRGEVDALIETIRKSVVKLLGTKVAAPAPKPEPQPEPKPAVKEEPKPEPAKAVERPKPEPKPEPEKEETKVAAASETPAVETTEKGGGIGVAPLVLWGVGALGVGAGVIFGLQAKSDEECANNASPDTPEGDRCYEGQRRAESAPQKAMLANIFLGVGGLALAAGTVFAILNIMSGPEEKTAWVPMLGPDSIGLAWTTEF